MSGGSVACSVRAATALEENSFFFFSLSMQNIFLNLSSALDSCSSHKKK